MPTTNQNNPNSSGQTSQPTQPAEWGKGKAGAVHRNVQNSDLVQTHMDNILAKDSPLMQRAGTQGKQYAGSRGLLDSSIGAEASMGAMIDRAMPMAQQDAGTYFQQGRANQDSSNVMVRDDKAFAFEGGQRAADRAHQSSMNTANLNFQATQNEANRQFQAAQDEIIRNFQAQQNLFEREFRAGESAAERQARSDELARASAQELFRQVSGMNASLTDAIAQIQSADLKKENKQSMVNNLIEMHYNNLATTTAMADFDIVDGQVVYRSSGPAQTQAGSTQPPPTSGLPNFRLPAGYAF